jgi:hypothetical protein
MSGWEAMPDGLCETVCGMVDADADRARGDTSVDRPDQHSEASHVWERCDWVLDFASCPKHEDHRIDKRTSEWYGLVAVGGSDDKT